MLNKYVTSTLVTAGVFLMALAVATQQAQARGFAAAPAARASVSVAPSRSFTSTPARSSRDNHMATASAANTLRHNQLGDNRECYVDGKKVDLKKCQDTKKKAK